MSGQRVDLDAVFRQLDLAHSRHAEALMVEIRAARVVVGVAEVLLDAVADRSDFRYPLGAELLRRAIAEYDRVTRYA